jgi:putative transcriptional regulator
MKSADTTRTMPTEPATDWTRLDAMTEAERHDAAIQDPDAQPLTPADMKRMRRTPRARVIRRALALTQEEFAARYWIPLGTLRDWEQGRSEPDEPTRAYLTVIARDPEAVRRALLKPTRGGLNFRV